MEELIFEDFRVSRHDDLVNLEFQDDHGEAGYLSHVTYLDKEDRDALLQLLLKAKECLDE